jgi:hypothetical protein
MLTFLAGRQRTRREHAELPAAAAFRLERETDVGGNFSILEAATAQGVQPAVKSSPRVEFVTLPDKRPSRQRSQAQWTRSRLTGQVTQAKLTSQNGTSRALGL